jgi:hypothetical protein
MWAFASSISQPLQSGGQKGTEQSHMQSIFLRKCLGSAVAVLLGPSLLMAITVKECPVRPATPASYTWNFPKETSGLFQQIMQRAYTVQNEAEELQELQSEADLVGWQPEADLMAQTRDDVNAMNEMLCRLRQIERMDSPWQQHAINRVTPKLIELASYTEMAMNYLNSHHDYLYSLNYNADINGIYLRAKRVNQLLHNSEEYASARHEVHTLGHELGIRSGG